MFVTKAVTTHYETDIDVCLLVLWNVIVFTGVVCGTGVMATPSSALLSDSFYTVFSLTI